MFARTSASEVALFDVLNEFNAFWIGDEIDPQTGLEQTHTVTLEYVRQSSMMLLGSDVGYIDLFDYIPGFPSEPLEDLIATSEVANGRRFASLSWLRRMKQAANRPQDQIDLERLPNPPERTVDT